VGKNLAGEISLGVIPSVSAMWCAPKRGIHRDSGIDLHGHSVGTAGVKTVQIQDFFEIEKQPLYLPPPRLGTQGIRALPAAGSPEGGGPKR
jgi:hypothetical protein